MVFIHKSNIVLYNVQSTKLTGDKWTLNIDMFNESFGWLRWIRNQIIEYAYIHINRHWHTTDMHSLIEEMRVDYIFVYRLSILFSHFPYSSFSFHFELFIYLKKCVFRISYLVYGIQHMNDKRKITLSSGVLFILVYKMRQHLQLCTYFLFQMHFESRIYKYNCIKYI